jgi:hypothetical protein
MNDVAPVPGYQITGGAGPEEAAAIAAAIAAVLEAERAARAAPQPRNVPPPWVTAPRFRPFEPPARAASLRPDGWRVFDHAQGESDST